MLLKKIKIYSILLLALFISFCAAYYSVSGLAKLFSGASFEVIVMTGTLEFSKVVVAGILHTYWSILNRVLKTYLTLATVILMVITSIGIYGFLTNAYQQTSMDYELTNSKIELIELRKNQFDDKIKRLEDQKNQIVENITELRKGLSNNVIEYIDKETGEKITTTSSSTRKSLEKQLNSALDKENEIDKYLRNYYDSLNYYNEQIIVSTQNNSAAAELGPLIFISSVFDMNMDSVVNYLILLLVFVFDPLAISLVILSSFLFKKNQIEIEINKEEKIKDKVFESIKNEIGESSDDVNEIEETNLDNNDIDDILDDMTENLTKKKIKSLSRSQIDNMSHQYLKKHLKGDTEN